MNPEIDVQKVAKLARLKLTAEEEVVVGERFKKVLGYVSLISELALDQEGDQRDETHLAPFREDVARPSGIRPEDFSAHTENGFFKVPSVIE
ncbi:MAG: hypothetical protein A2600_06965 [Candidatus Lambdaproteobacteria bacterium RIFOXYD1_FULL_56_27]|uniref:Aspartyl/glutamyl-tRNA(Asn/Gln) amidotransferase subunit C n=1 Tax=Candidatus Lambdaproteobacteria bacterium RIFOXYD2_FULL_56_26 TaxID=1817773 RepID=A0A1F6GQ11_9PROT|nr:MAG: hypothetical protein A2557_05625 [Candidatus Lambdaproteobacteria bacterium RIFOXYD2_FULL_56_26]OGH03673.1 MAG: hypothetical protein A2426_00415 [Candidatus Lambdaproteobacteria bacterium RIFOXYC1_FULL_56_13]OGH07257.1 MAG: hypothetical protein A2600_06965 [Candidatus Lambdaproteobacteria bacterium RIFOXYD1_FULL_56_27]